MPGGAIYIEEQAQMSLTFKESLTALHGLILGAGFLLAFTGGFAGLWGFRSEWLTNDGARAALRRMMLTTWTMAVLAWATVFIGTYALYPWYRAKPPDHITGLQLQGYPRSVLLANAGTAGWHKFGMEWKEHIAWWAPILATAVAVVVARQRHQLLRNTRLRRALLFLFSVSFFCAAVAAFFGAFINKTAPLR
jgi:hypothetical protein